MRNAQLKRRERRQIAYLQRLATGTDTYENWVAEQMCGDKAIYDDYDAALAAAIRSSRNIGPCRAYKCPVCGGYHLTTQVEVYDAAWADAHPQDLVS